MFQLDELPTAPQKSNAAKPSTCGTIGSKIELTNKNIFNYFGNPVTTTWPTIFPKPIPPTTSHQFDLSSPLFRTSLQYLPERLRGCVDRCNITIAPPPPQSTPRQFHQVSTNASTHCPLHYIIFLYFIYSNIFVTQGNPSSSCRCTDNMLTNIMTTFT